jgi:hypothetical protein
VAVQHIPAANVVHAGAGDNGDALGGDVPAVFDDGVQQTTVSSWVSLATTPVSSRQGKEDSFGSSDEPAVSSACPRGPVVVHAQPKKLNVMASFGRGRSRRFAAGYSNGGSQEMQKISGNM